MQAAGSSETTVGNATLTASRLEDGIYPDFLKFIFKMAVLRKCTHTFKMEVCVTHYKPETPTF
jgi:hypothetical protein